MKFKSINSRSNHRTMIDNAFMHLLHIKKWCQSGAINGIYNVFKKILYYFNKYKHCLYERR